MSRPKHNVLGRCISTGINSQRLVLWQHFTALHGMQTRSSDENYVCLSVCLSNTWIVTKRKKDMSRFLYRWWGRPLLPEIVGQPAPVERKRRFSTIFARAALAVTPSEKRSINTNRKSNTRFPMSLRWSSYVAPKPPIFVQWAAITPQRYEIGCQLLLIINRKLHTGFRLVPTLMTLNDLERRNSLYFAFFTELDSCTGQLLHSGWR